MAKTLQACWDAGIGEDYVAVASRRGRHRAEHEQIRAREDLDRTVGALR
jgi:hypothetical protein